MATINDVIENINDALAHANAVKEEMSQKDQKIEQLTVANQTLRTRLVEAKSQIDEAIATDTVTDELERVRLQAASDKLVVDI